MNILIEAMGWCADLLFLTAFFLVSRKKISGEGKPFNLMNLGGAVLYGSYAVIKKTWPVLVLEVFWGLVAVTALWKLYKVPLSRSAHK